MEEMTFLESLSADEALTAIYIGYFDRAPDPEGFTFWQGILDDGYDLNGDGSSLDDVAANFAGQEETLTVHPFFTDPDAASAGAFITEVYANLFNREPDAAGLEFWTAQLQGAIDGTGALSVGEIILQIIGGAEGNDRLIIENKISVGMSFQAAANANDIEFDDDAMEAARDVLDGVNATDASVAVAADKIADFVAGNTGGTPSTPGELFILSTGGEDGTRDNLEGTAGNDTFEAYNFELQDGDRMDGGAGQDTLEIFNNEFGATKSPITTSVETVVHTNQLNDLNSQGDNNVGGYGNRTTEVDVEIDAGQMSGVTRWEDYDSRADLVIEDARDLDDTDGTFTGDITVAMVSTDPGNVDYAVYFDQPVNVSQNFGTLELRVLDQEAAFGKGAPSAGSTGYLNESSLISFKFEFDDQEIEVTLADQLGVTYGPNVSFSDLLTQVSNATTAALVAAGVTDLGFTASLGAPVSVGVGNQFTLPIVLTFDVTADSIAADQDNIVVLGRDQNGNDATDTFGSLSTDRTTTDELIRLNVDLDDVGKGSMGGDAMFGAMSTGRQAGDDRTSDSLGIQQFDIEVDRSSQLQTINSTNNSLRVVNIDHGENDGPNNTTTATDEMAGDLVVRGVANPSVNLDNNGTADPSDDFLFNGQSGVATDGFMPGAAPQHNAFGFSDVQVIDARGMTGVQADGSIGSADITAELTEEIVEKYLNIQDDGPDGEDDDVDFSYSFGGGDDEFLLNMSADALNLAGTGSREDFDLTISGGGGNDVITTNIGGETVEDFDGIISSGAVKRIDEQGQDYYELTSTNNEGWYTNAVSNVAAEFSVSGGNGNDTIWTHGWGDFRINAGTGADVVYSDNSGAVEYSQVLGNNLDRINRTETPDQIDYVVGAAWAFNAEGGTSPFNISGATNNTITLGTIAATPVTATSGSATVTVRYAGPSGVAGTEYITSATIPFSELNVNSTTGVVTIDEQALNQAIKKAINDDGILGNLLEATDGPGNSLIVASMTDGIYTAGDLDIDVTSLTVNSSPVTVVPLAVGGEYDTSGANVQFVQTGSASIAESDNTIIVNGGDGARDLYVLSTNGIGGADGTDTSDDGSQDSGNGTLDSGSDLNNASEETLVINSGFGVDTVVNFAAGDGDATTFTGEDIFEFSNVTGVANNTLIGGGVAQDISATSANGTVDILALANVDGADGSTANGTVEMAEILAIAGAGDTTASNHVYIVHNTNNDNGGEMWHVVDGVAPTGDVTATELGTINLIGTDWTAITTDNIA